MIGLSPKNRNIAFYSNIQTSSKLVRPYNIVKATFFVRQVNVVIKKSLKFNLQDKTYKMVKITYMCLTFKQQTQSLPQTTISELALLQTGFIKNFSIKNDSLGSRKVF